MSSAAIPLRLTDAVAAPEQAPLRLTAAETQLEVLQREFDAMKAELEALRRRDDTLQFYMHRLDEELRLAARLQQDFLPKSLPRVGNIRFHTLFRPAGHVSGDLYDVMRLDESHIGFYMADAVGHGMPAALLTMFLKQALVTKEIQPGGYRLLEPSQTMARLNEALVEQNLAHATFATALYGYVNTKTMQLTFARGGHPNPLLLKSGGELQSLDADGSLLGIFPGEQFGQTTVALAPGDKLFVYSDGIELAFSEGETLDTNRWRVELQKRRDLSTEQIIGALGEHIDRVSQNTNRKSDDLTVIALEVGN